MKRLSFRLLLFLTLLVLVACQRELHFDEANKPPVADAGADQLITLPTQNTILDGNASKDVDGTLIQYTWRKVSGPDTYKFASPTAAKTELTQLGIGVYQFELKVTDNGGLSDQDTLLLSVVDNTQPNRPPVANAGPDQIIQLPTQTATLNGSNSSDPDQNITNYEWTKIAGPAPFNYTNATASMTQVSNLTLGSYTFELKVTDAGGLSDRDTIIVAVQANNPTTVDVYVTGGNGAPKYWKNGQEFPLYPDLNGDDLAISIAISNQDVYIAGDDNEPFFNVTSWPRYWKNGQEHRLTDGSKMAGTHSITVDGNNVYVAGWEYILNTNTSAVYWKNGQKIILTDTANDAEARCIQVVGNDVYVVGYEMNANGIRCAKYWKNGQGFWISNGPQETYARKILVVGNDIYVLGFQRVNLSNNFVPKLWKNNQELPIPAGATSISSMTIQGSDLYLAGLNQQYYACYWKNGQETILAFGGSAAAIAVDGPDIYVAGSSGPSQFVYWKNGQVTLLPNASSVTDIQLARR